MTDLPTLIGRLEAGETGREVEWRIAEATGHPSFERSAGSIFPPFMPGSNCDKAVPRYLASLDAAIAFTEAALPGWDREVGVRNGTSFAMLTRKEPFFHMSAYELGRDREPVALVIAALKARMENAG